MEIAAKYDPSEVEDKWYKYWLQQRFFHSEPDAREPYCIVIPPPNVTGVLHMGHMLNNTIQDVLVRRARMQGKNACWVPGTDHASIATEARVVAKLANEGINKFDLTRDQFLNHAWEWTHKHGGIILEQLKKLGASCDWDRTCFTMDEPRSESVIKVFVDLYKKNKVYRGVRMVNWDTKAKTAVSDEEVIYKEEKSKLYFVKYFITDANGNKTPDNSFITVATTRPETILGDTAVCVNPNDDRYKHLKGKNVLVPLVNRVVPIIFDEYVDPEFGTGALKITPAHDLADYELGLKYKLEVIDIFNEDGTINEKGQLYVGVDRFEARTLSVKKLDDDGILVKFDEYVNKVGYSERTHVVIEPRLSVQWFLKMKDISKPALDAVLNNTIKLHPHKFINTYRHWMENVKDWCISRQLWWGHRIPAYYLPNGDYVVAETETEALQLAKAINANYTFADLKQDEDVLDTWFSSWLWPISVFDGIRQPENKEIQYYYPTHDLVTAPEILFFWVARMVISGYEYRNAECFRNVYLTGIVRDKQRRKMSKSLGNSPEPIELIQKYSADGVRVGMLFSSPAGNDLLYDDSLCEQGRNFGNKIWNAFRLVKSWQVDTTIPQPQYAQAATLWFNNVLNKAITNIDERFNEYQLSDALMNVYKLFWDDFSSWYLEMVKPEYQKPIDKATFEATVNFFDKLLKLLHPFMPFITEEIWHLLETREQDESIMVSAMPKANKVNETILHNFELIQGAITEIRSIRKDKNIANKEQVALQIFNTNVEYNKQFEPVLVKLANLSQVNEINEKPHGATPFMVRTTEFFVIANITVDIEAELKKHTAELAYYKGFLDTVMKKLGNEKFVASAPQQVVDLERKKHDDALSKIKAIEEQIRELGV